MKLSITGHRWFALLSAGLLILLPRGAYACSVCFGLGVDNATTRGISMAMLGLLAVLGVVWGGIGAFFMRMHRRTQMLEPGDWVVTEQGEIEAPDTEN